jgi:hypothetical protein
LVTAERLEALDLGIRVSQDLGIRASQTDEDLTVDLTAGSGAGLTEDSDSIVDSGAGVAALVLAGAGDSVGAGIRGGAGDRRGGVGAPVGRGDGVILPTRTGE